MKTAKEHRSMMDFTELKLKDWLKDILELPFPTEEIYLWNVSLYREYIRFDLSFDVVKTSNREIVFNKGFLSRLAVICDSVNLVGSEDFLFIFECEIKIKDFYGEETS